MDVRQLEMFRAVAEEGTFTRAAERLHVSQSAVSRQLQLLEEELRTLLFHRTGRGVTLTDSGQLLLTTANRINRDMQDVVSQISQTEQLQRGVLRLGAGMTVCLYVFPKLLKKFRGLYKNLDLRVAAGTADEILRLLRTNELDLALLTLPIVAEDLEIRPVLKEEMVVVGAKGHPLTRERHVDPQQLRKHPMVLFESGSNTRHVLDEFFREQQIPVNVVMETENVEIIKAMVAAGLGVTVIPYAAIASEARTGRFEWARIRGHRLVRETGWVFVKSDFTRRSITEVLRVFEMMKDQFGGKPPGR
ncbi:MAG TPA: LysR family transcriptional regulator [Thermoanaerobaculia bacterium]|nr:LysR family transcriptional regulator [Thermoanaerobaculia bacterium]